MSTTAQRPRWLESRGVDLISTRENRYFYTSPEWGFCRNGLSLLASWVGFDVCGFDHIILDVDHRGKGVFCSSSIAT